MNQPAAEPDVPGCTNFVAIGRGAFATVFRARQDAFDRDVAVKVLDAQSLSGESAARFVRECRAVGALSWHPNVITVYDAGVAPSGNGYLVMSWMDGGTLADALSDGPLEPRYVVQVGIAIAGALEATHRAGRLHRDVKPDNILIGAAGEPQLADYGIAAVAGHALTVEGAQAFSPSHVAPEIVSGQPASAASDVYSLASTLYALLAGQPPFNRADDVSLLQVMNRLTTEPPPPLPPFVPAPIGGAILRALAKAPEDRPSSAAHFADLLLSAGASLGWKLTPPVLGPSSREAMRAPRPPAQPPPAPPDHPTAATPPKRRSPHDSRGRLVAVGVLVVAIVAVAVGVPGLLRGPAPDATSETATEVSEAPTDNLRLLGAPPDLEEVLATVPDPYTFQPATQSLQNEVRTAANRIDPAAETIADVVAAEVYEGRRPVAVVIAYALTPAAANPLVVEDRLVAATLDAGVDRLSGAPPTWSGTVTGPNGVVNRAGVVLSGQAVLVVLASLGDQLDQILDPWRAALR